MCELLPVLCELFISQFDFELLLLFYILSGQTKLYIYIFSVILQLRLFWTRFLVAHAVKTVVTYESKNGVTVLLPIISPNADRFQTQ